MREIVMKTKFWLIVTHHHFHMVKHPWRNHVTCHRIPGLSPSFENLLVFLEQTIKKALSELNCMQNQPVSKPTAWIIWWYPHIEGINNKACQKCSASLGIECILEMEVPCLKQITMLECHWTQKVCPGLGEYHRVFVSALPLSEGRL